MIRKKRRDRHKRQIERYRETISVALNGLRLYNMTHFYYQREIYDFVKNRYPELDYMPATDARNGVARS